MGERRQILRLADAAVEAEGVGGFDSVTVNLDAAGADLLLLLVEHPGQGSALADLCAGLPASSSGRVQFLGRQWRKLPPDTANALRGRIGRVFREGGWIEQLSLTENILLQQRHHTRRPLPHLLRQASRLGRRFGLPGLPLGRPDAYAAADLQRAAWVRAFLGEPTLVLLEEPTRHLGHRSRSPLINVIREARDRGAAVIWMTMDRTIWQDATIPATRHYRWVGRALMEMRPK